MWCSQSVIVFLEWNVEHLKYTCASFNCIFSLLLFHGLCLLIISILNLLSGSWNAGKTWLIILSAVEVWLLIWKPVPMILCMKMLSIHCHESTYLETFPHLFVEMIDNHMLSHGLKNCSYNFKTLLTRQAALNCCNMNAYYWCKVSLICEMSICPSLNIRYLLQLGV